MDHRTDALNPAAIRIRHLSVSFANRPVLRDLSLDIPAGGLTFLLGRSGSGKTTLLRAINRLNECLPGCATCGQIELQLGATRLDAYAPSTPVEELRRRAGMVFQSPNVLPLSIARNLSLPLAVTLGLGAAECEARTEQALREVHLWNEVKNRLGAPAATLSGGQQQRLCLARTLALRPDILLLDEPTASLDFKAARQIEELLAELKLRYTLLVVSHSLSQAHRLADQVFVLHDGQRIEALPESTFRDKEALMSALDELV
ncbi:phosphate ABC transporter ATP-binding protein [Propionivibrio limicola]|uniref:phosphate ABC transporter ATP-binding protein n=1 Tax=Propionivibrio limicola TaxID=167645 RepID=UPI001290CC42|nr:phosphate ABC transporter ATP-binding protein [Propionivibrio limicola]